ncbi:LPS export ABC transporter permease LptG [Candidatus Thioglobus sp.]|uniref:LPS export ABC transporter permease LptG n=1 Tax=Candidatus Thioglobus sp. TaxID=2026721 RepID=UPI0026373F6E|nr:LPS export ABC transporter permease LptG [Candidatus Thioglobus sp.]MDG2395493.1 LPS export ABC transporter permease LptG [Candidatus Thioglobus sp.]
MKILDRYIVKTMTSYTLGVMLIWVGIYSFFRFLDEVNDIGRADYTIIEAITYISLKLPNIISEHSSVVILLGALLALGHLATTSQLIIIRGSGVSIMSIAKIVIKTTLAFIMLAILIGELLAPNTTEYAEKSRAKALGHNIQAKSQQGFWVKDGADIIHVNKNFDGRLFGDVTLVKLKNSNTLKSITRADNAVFDGKNLKLEQTEEYQIQKNPESFYSFSLDRFNQYQTAVSFDQEFIDSLRKEPSELSTWNLAKQIIFLSDNNLAADNYEVEFYKRLVKPFTLVAMVLFSMSFIFGSLRDASLGQKIFLGVMLSLFFELFSRMSAVLSLRFDYNHFLVASIPTLVFLIFALILLKRKSVQ